MKFYSKMLAGTALALCVAGTAIAGAGPLAPLPAQSQPGLLILAQDEGNAQPEAEQPKRKKRAEAEQSEKKKARPAEEAPARKQREATDEPSQAEEQPRKKRRAEQAQAPAEQQPAEVEQPRKKRAADGGQPEQKKARSAEERAKQAESKKRTEKKEPAQAEAPAAEEPARAEEQPRKKRASDSEQPEQKKTRSAEERAKQAERKKRAEQGRSDQAEVPATEDPSQAEEQPKRKQQRQADRDRKPADTEAAPTEEPVQAEDQPRKRRDDRKRPVDATQPADAKEPASAEGENPARASEENARTDEQNRRKNRKPRDGGKAPILDSAKEQPDEARRPRRTEAAGPPPADDRAAQAERIDREKLARADSEKGQRIDRERARERRRERPDGSDVLREIGDRIVIQLGDQIMVEDKDRGRRIRRDARDVYYEELPRGRQREIVERRDGSRIVTIRDQYGDVIRRSRIEPDGNEIILAYVDEDAFERDDRDGIWRDPGRDLPPLELSIPAEEYILDAERAPDPESYYEFLDQPPVEKVQRYYSVDEVKRSARIRDTVRRVDLDTITFEFGSADIAEGQVERLDNVAQAMEKLLKQNPAETFLIEGHTDAVGSDVANLALSDRRAEAVAQALTDVFEIPPENLETQGYGEEYLKVNTDGPERENRRVSIRRITPLVAPVASAE